MRGALDSGELGYPVMNVKATITAAEVDEQLSNDTAFQAAGADAVRKAMRDNMVLLEPWMKLHGAGAEESRGGSIMADVDAPDEARCNATSTVRERVGRRSRRTCRWRNLFDYADKVRSLSQGRASSTMEPFALPAGSRRGAAAAAASGGLLLIRHVPGEGPFSRGSENRVGAALPRAVPSPRGSANRG